MTALLRLHLKPLLGALLFMAMSFSVKAQTKEVTGKVTDPDGKPASGVSVTVKGGRTGTQTSADGSFKLNIPASASTLVFSGVGFETEEVNVSGTSVANVTLKRSNATISEVVVIGYGTARKKDLTGAVATVKAKDFNKGVITAPDQLIQGKVAGVQIFSSSGAPNAENNIRIRGTASVRAGNSPLFVIDGIILDGRSPRPGFSGQDIGNTPNTNPLAFINPNDIASMDILKDASATAIYGSRGANGVVIVTTKRGQTGAPKIEFNASYGLSKISRRFDYLSGDEYRAALSAYGLTSGNRGSSVDALDAILQTGSVQNYNVTTSGGLENARYRLSLGYFDQKGIIRKTGFKKYNANLNSQFRFLESKKLGLDVNLFATHTDEQVAPVATNAGFRGSLVGMALQWNPTRALRKANGELDIDNGGSEVNPLAMSEAYNDRANVSTIIASIAPSYKITNELEYKMQLNLNYASSVRKAEIRNWINLEGVQASSTAKGGVGFIGTGELITRQITHTLNYNKNFNKKLNFRGLLGYEYIKTDNKGGNQSGRDFDDFSRVPYYNMLGFASQGTRQIGAFADPTSELQSFFGRVELNHSDKYQLSATMRADGSSKFGANNRYGYFPSFSAAWNIGNEDFMRSISQISNLKIRAGWGQTGNQEFPAGSAQTRFVASGPGGLAQESFANPDLKWQTDQQVNVGLDFGLLRNRITVTVDYFNKKTNDLIVNEIAGIPSPGTRIWKNIEGNIVNKGIEASINASIVNKKDFTWTAGVFATFQKNEVSGLAGPLLTGAINGQGLSGAFVQRHTNGQPANVYYVRNFQGIASDGQAVMENDGASFVYAGSPNPTTLLGITTSLTYKKLSLDINMNGAFGHKLYNNTANAVLPINNLGSRNIAKALMELPVKEALSSPITTSSRYLESGNYMRLANATLAYRFGDLGRSLRGVTMFITGANLFVITKFTGFDPEVNVDKNIDGVPSFGIEYTPYPAARTFTFGFNFGL
jgi:TonB-dependent starch-binding outer membrane protein SusC